MLANGNGSGVTAAISAERAPTQQSALDWQQHARRNCVSSRQFYWNCFFDAASCSSFLSDCELSLTLFASIFSTLVFFLVSVTLVQLLM